MSLNLLNGRCDPWPLLHLNTCEQVEFAAFGPEDRRFPFLDVEPILSALHPL